MDQSPPSTSPEKGAGLRRNLAFILIVSILALASIILGTIGSTSPLSLHEARRNMLHSAALAIAWAPLLAAAFWLAWQPERAIGLLLLLCAASPDWLETFAIQTPIAKLYLYDVLLALLLAGILFRSAADWNRSPFPRTALNRPILIFALAGLFFLIRGLPEAQRANDALGDFRRAYFYPLIFFASLWCVRKNSRAPIWIAGGFLTGAFIQLISGYLGIAAGRFHQLFFADVYHVLSHYSTTMLSILFYFGLAALIYRSERRERTVAVTLAASVLLLILIANFRAAWVGIFAGTTLIAMRFGGKIRLLRPFLMPAIVTTLLIVAAFAIIGQIEIAPGVTLQGEVTEKFSRLIHFRHDPNVLWRFASYRAAIETWGEHPFLGTGLGHFLTFSVPGAFGGSYIAFNHRVHNSYLWFLYTTGIVGAALFLWLHATLFLALWRRAIQSHPGWKAVWALAFLGFYAHFMTVTIFHHLLESSTTELSLFALAGITLPIIASAESPAPGEAQ